MDSQKLENSEENITNKLKRIIELESLLKTEFSSNGFDLKITRKIYACIDGFIILRTFSETSFEPMQFTFANERLEHFIKKNLPIKTNEGNKNLYELLKNSIGIELKIGQTIDIGSQGKGLTIGGRLKLDGFQILIREYNNIEEIQKIMEDMFIANRAYLSSEEITALGN